MAGNRRSTTIGATIVTEASVSKPRLHRSLRLWFEFTAIFVATPLVMALGLPPQIIWSGLACMLLVAIVLLSVTRAFEWRSLMSGHLVPAPLVLAAFVVLAAVVAIALVAWLRPHAMFFLPRYNERLWLTIMIAYPFVSALPQEIVFRALFFERYGKLFPSPAVAISANAAVFSLAHLFYWNIPAVVLTAIGGAVFAWAYLRMGSFPFAWLLHSIGGQIIFTTGLGVFFYHGAV